jgi:positive regulator of sigma E activity
MAWLFFLVPLAITTLAAILDGDVLYVANTYIGLTFVFLLAKAWSKSIKREQERFQWEAAERSEAAERKKITVSEWDTLG